MKSPVINDHAPGMRARAVSSQGQAADGGTPAPAAGGWAICCSGGGVRSAAYCLGALQRLDRIGLLASGFRLATAPLDRLDTKSAFDLE
jgi:hypothetical protein